MWLRRCLLRDPACIPDTECVTAVVRGGLGSVCGFECGRGSGVPVYSGVA